MSKNRNYESQSSKQGTVEQTTEEVAVEENKTEVQQEQDNAVVTTTAAPVVEVKEVEEPKKESLDSFETRIDWVKQNGSTTEKQVINVLENYVKVCTTSISLEAIAIEQQRLWRLFEYIHSNPTEFRKLFNIVIEFGKKYKESAFDISMFFRAQGALSLSGDSLQAFNNIRTLIINTINTNNKANIKSILDIRKIIENNAIPEHVRAQYVAYYE
jgi:hypothetical protein